MVKFISLHSKRERLEINVAVNVDNINWFEDSGRSDNPTAIFCKFQTPLFVTETVKQIRDILAK